MVITNGYEDITKGYEDITKGYNEREWERLNTRMKEIKQNERD